MLTDLFVYDWWSLLLGFCGELDVENGNDERAQKQIKWIGELMGAQMVSVRAVAPAVPALAAPALADSGSLLGMAQDLPGNGSAN